MPEEQTEADEAGNSPSFGNALLGDSQGFGLILDRLISDV
jgi:hypothetical protein